MENLLSGTRGQGYRGDFQALVARQEEFRKKLGGQKAILSMECFNNMEYERFVPNRTTG